MPTCFARVCFASSKQAGYAFQKLVAALQFFSKTTRALLVQFEHSFDQLSRKISRKFPIFSMIQSEFAVKRH